MLYWKTLRGVNVVVGGRHWDLWFLGGGHCKKSVFGYKYVP